MAIPYGLSELVVFLSWDMGKVFISPEDYEYFSTTNMIDYFCEKASYESYYEKR